MTQAIDPISLIDQQHIVLTDISWEFYEKLLQEVGDRAIRITYHEGRIEIMSPLSKHDVWKSRIGRMVEVLGMELDIPMVPFGSTTFRDAGKKAGLEPDECYYIQKHSDVVPVKDRLDLSVDPAPDLAIEVDITRRSIARLPIYAALGVPEVWRYDGRRLHILYLAEDQKYLEHQSSLAFPFLPMKRFVEFLDLHTQASDHEAIRKFQQWIRELKVD